ncbi:MAG: MazG nucleotide pyrophosphohydrolase domain-containing protein, partial [Gaiellales bacterium]
KEQRGLFSGVPQSMPSLGRARKTASKAANIGFDFANPHDALAKLEEEVAELREAIERAEAAGNLPSGSGELPDPRVEAELGDVVFAAANVARLMNVDPELATSDATRTFQTRVETAIGLAADADTSFADLDLDAQEQWYQRAKAHLAQP